MAERAEREPEYDDRHMRFLELLWGEGYLSPGGTDEVDRVVSGIDFTGTSVLDLGCGSGGISLYLARRYAPAHVTGFDVEAPAIDRAQASAELAGITGKVSFIKGLPGPLPFPDRHFDIVFSKDAIIHIPDKHALASEVFRVLKPRGVFAASDWLISHDGEPTVEMKAYIAAEGLSFGMASPARYKHAFDSAGFQEVSVVSRNAWYREEARRELDRLSNELYRKAVALVGELFVRKNLNTWIAMQKVLDSGEHCPTHLRAVRPGEGQ
jgi:phosphoethanolamine N-methyltransferase